MSSRPHLSPALACAAVEGFMHGMVAEVVIEREAAERGAATYAVALWLCRRPRFASWRPQ